MFFFSKNPAYPSFPPSLAFLPTPPTNERTTYDLKKSIRSKQKKNKKNKGVTQFRGIIHFASCIQRGSLQYGNRLRSGQDSTAPVLLSDTP
jgi:hypothetical protein